MKLWLLFLLPLTSLAAERDSFSVMLGATAAQRSTTLDGYKITSDTRLKYGGGVRVNAYQLSPTVSVQVGVHYNMYEVGYTEKLVQEFAAVQLPIAAYAKFADTIQIGAGPYVSYGMGNVKTTSTVGTSEVTTTQSYTDAGFEKLDFGAYGAITLYLPFLNLGDFKTMVDAAAYYGLRDVDKAEDVTSKHITGTVSIGLTYAN